MVSSDFSGFHKLTVAQECVLLAGCGHHRYFRLGRCVVPALALGWHILMCVFLGLTQHSDLKTSIFYLCCHSLNSHGIKSALEGLRWTSFEIDFDSVSCSVDAHDNQTLYINAVPSDTSALDAWAKQLTSALKEQGVDPHQPFPNIYRCWW